MTSDQVQMYHVSPVEETNDKENVILRALVGDPSRYKPLAQHQPPTAPADQAAVPASMYTLESRYRPIPSKVLPKSQEPKVYYIEAQKAEQTSEPNPAIMTEEPEPQQMIMLEPKVISQPVLYCIVGAKTPLSQSDQPAPTTTTEMPSSLFYTITGQPHPPAANISAPALNVPPPVIDRSPFLYTLVASPRLQVRIQEPVKEVVQIPQQSSSNLYTVVGNPHIPPSAEEPMKTTAQIPKQSTPLLYSIVANPTLAPHIIYSDTSDPPPATHAIKTNSIQPVPILYTVVGEAQVPNNISKANRLPLGPIKKQANDTPLYAVVGDPNIPQSLTIPRKNEPLQPLKQQLPPISTPILYTLVGKPSSSSGEKPGSHLKRPIQNKTSKPIAPIQRISRSLDRQTAPEPRTEPVTSIPPVKNKRQRPLKEPTIPKSETTFFPLPDKERTPRPKQPRTTPWKTSPERTQYQPHQVPNYDPLHLPDYISPYAYHPLKSYRSQTVHPNSLPIIKNKRSSRKPIYEPRQRAERNHPYGQWTPHSLERHPDRSRERPRVWDYEDEAQTDVDDDADRSDTDSRRRGYRRRRPRTPWVPVW